MMQPHGGCVTLLLCMRYFLVFFRLLLLYCGALLFDCFNVTAQPVAIAGDALPPWKEGMLDIHHINTGRGNAAFCIFPDGTTLQIDAGELAVTDARTFSPRNASIRPNYSKKPYEWQADYIHQMFPGGRRPKLDYALITHFHDDHFGNWYPGAPMDSSGSYYLTGITGLGTLIPVRCLVDRGAPAYKYPYDLRVNPSRLSGEIDFTQTMENYFRFIAVQQSKGLQLEGLKAGSRAQIRMQYHPEKYPGCYVQNVKCNEQIWTGKDSATYRHFPTVDTSGRSAWPDENSLSLALVIHYGKFNYYSGGDNPGILSEGDHPLRDVETPIAKAVGEADVAVLDHHGNRDGLNAFFIKTLHPQVWIGQSWSADHPGHEVLARLINKHIYPEPRDLFCTNMLEANRTVIGPLIDRAYKSTQGHIVVRVMPGGSSFYVIILDDNNEERKVKAMYGPYASR